MIFSESENVELKEVVVDDIRKEIIAFANSDGGTILIGVDDDGAISGVNAPNMEMQVINICRNNIRPSLIPRISKKVLPYALLRYFLIGSAAYHGGLDEARFIRAVYAFSRRIEHHNSFLKHILELLERNGYDTPAGLVALVKEI